MRIVIFLTALHLGLLAGAQTLTLGECLQLSRENYPLMADFENLNQQLELKLKQLNTNYYPRLDGTLQYSWQNDVPGFDAPMPGFEVPQASKQQYRAYVDVKQVIYDGGVTKALKQVEENRKVSDKLDVEVQLYSIRNKVIEAYFMHLILDEQLKQLNYKQDALRKRSKEMGSAVKNGVLLQSELDLIEVELLKTDQDKIAIKEGQEAAGDILEELTGVPVNGNKTLVMPLMSNKSLRPEYAYFASQQSLFDSYQSAKGKQRLPNISGFGQVGYGNPGYNMLKDELDAFYMVGVRLQWNIWDWKATSNEKAILKLQSQSVSNYQAAFSQNLRIAEKDINSKISRLEQVIAKDEDILALRQRITKARESQLNNGTITASDYIRELNAESMAALNKEIHVIEKSKAEVELNELGQNYKSSGSSIIAKP